MDNKKRKFVRMFKKYGYYCLAGVLTVAIALTITFMSKDKSNEYVEPNNNVPVQVAELNFGLPVENATLIKGFSDSSLQYNSTMKQWEAHKGVDLTSDSLFVYAVLDGEVASVDYTFEKGTTVTLTHLDGFTTTYSSLAKDTELKQGDKVKKGDKIGEMADSANNELSDGKHVHLEVLKDGTKVDPSNYIEFELK